MTMYYRSWLFVPGDSERKLGKAIGTGADVIVVDLDSSVSPYGKATARQIAAHWLKAHRQSITESKRLGRWVRINPLDSRQWRDDLLAVMASAPDGIMLPRAAGPEAVRQVAAEIYELEQRHQVPLGTTRVMAVAGETPQAAMTIGQYLDAPHQRLAGLAWSPAGLCATIGATRERIGKTGGWSDPLRFVRAQTLLAAHACAIMALDTVHADFTDLRGLKTAARAARADGFTGMLAIHPDQVPVINEAFTPSEEELDHARRVVAAFDTENSEGVVPLDRRSIDQPSLKIARRMLGIDEHPAQDHHRGPVLRPA